MIKLLLNLRPVARLPSGGCVSERRRREDRDAAGAEGGGREGGVEGSGRGQKIFEFLKQNDVFWCTLESMDFILNLPAREGS